MTVDPELVLDTADLDLAPGAVEAWGASLLEETHISGGLHGKGSGGGDTSWWLAGSALGSGTGSAGFCFFFVLLNLVYFHWRAKHPPP
jgi:hypothetical protein